MGFKLNGVLGLLDKNENDNLFKLEKFVNKL